MAIQISCILIGNGDFQENALREALLPEFKLEEFELSSSLTDSFQILVETNFNLCFISESVNADLGPFFKDMKTLGRDKTCAFVKVRATAENPPALPTGFCCCISKHLTENDNKDLRKALRVEVQRIECERKAKTVPSYVDRALKEIDRVALNRLRGKTAGFDKVFGLLLSSLNQDAAGLRDRYYESLTDLTDSSSPFEARKMEVPDEILSRNLPKLEKDKYSGASNRVWKQVLTKFKVD